MSRILVNNKKTIIVFILCIVMFVFSLLGVIFIPSVFFTEYDDSNTVEYSAIVDSAEKKDNKFYIKLYDYNCVIVAQSIEVSNAEYLLGLNNVKIYFRIDSGYANWMNNNELSKISIVTLNTDDVEIVNFESHNKINAKKENTIYIMCIILMVIFFLISIYCVLNIFGISIFKKKNLN